MGPAAGAGILTLGPCLNLIRIFGYRGVSCNSLEQGETQHVSPSHRSATGQQLTSVCPVFLCFYWAKPEPSTVTNPQGYVIMRGSERRRSIWKIYNCSCPSALSHARLLADNASNLHAAGITMKCCVAGLVGPRPGRARAAIHLSLLGQSEGPGFDPTQHSENRLRGLQNVRKPIRGRSMYQIIKQARSDEAWPILTRKRFGLPGKVAAVLKVWQQPCKPASS